MNPKVGSSKNDQLPPSMNYYIVLLLVHLAGTILALWLTAPVKPPRRYNPGDCKESKLDGKHPVYWDPMS